MDGFTLAFKLEVLAGTCTGRVPRHAPTHFSVPRCVKKCQVPRYAAGAQVSDVHTVDCSSLSESQCPTDDNLGQGPVNMQVGV